VNILYIADPNSIHDIRWINFLAEREAIKCFLIGRYSHFQKFVVERSLFNSNVTILAPIRDPSTIWLWKNWYEAFKIRRIIRKHQIGLLHILYAEPNALWARWKCFFKIPVVVTTHGTDILKTIPQFFQEPGILNRLVSKQYLKALKCADHITCTSFLQVEHIEKLKVFSAVTIVRTGVDFKMIERAHKKACNLPEIKKSFVLMPRSMKAIYNHEFTLEAIALLDGVLKEKYAFVFLDSLTRNEQYFQDICRRAVEIDAEIRFLPALDHSSLLAFYRLASLVVMNPLSDGSPVTAMEALACKIPIILPPLNYDKELFGDTFVFEEWTPGSLKTKIEDVLKADPLTLAGSAERNYQRILKFGNADIEMAKLKVIYESLLHQ